MGMKHLDLDGHDLPPSPAPSSPSNGRKYALATELVYTEGNDQYNSSSVPIYQSATFKGGPGQEYDYTRSGNPTRTHLERALPEDIIRLCVGIEDLGGLIDDLSQALV